MSLYVLNPLKHSKLFEPVWSLSPNVLEVSQHCLERGVVLEKIWRTYDLPAVYSDRSRCFSGLFRLLHHMIGRTRNNTWLHNRTELQIALLVLWSMTAFAESMLIWFYELSTWGSTEAWGQMYYPVSSNLPSCQMEHYKHVGCGLHREILLHFFDCWNMFAANPTFARIGSRISVDMLKSMRRVSVFSTLQSLKPKNPQKRKPQNPKNLNPKLRP